MFYITQVNIDCVHKFAINTEYKRTLFDLQDDPLEPSTEGLIDGVVESVQVCVEKIRVLVDSLHVKYSQFFVDTTGTIFDRYCERRGFCQCYSESVHFGERLHYTAVPYLVYGCRNVH